MMSMSDGASAVADERSVRTSWPLSTHLALGALPSAVPCARLHARVVLAEWGLGAAAETAELVVSELMTNAIAASSRCGAEDALPVVHLRLSADGAARILVEVRDRDPSGPSGVRQPGPDDESGRGLLLVEALADRWGWHPAGRQPGKVVWAYLAGGDA
jgi:anti-sigma regulatory factor (Ser/Thr protein kinase)